MSADILFEEVQGISGAGIKKIIKIITGIIFVSAIAILIIQKDQINQSTILLSIVGLICIGIGLFPSFTLTTQIRADGIYLRFLPMQLSFTKYLWGDIEEVYVKKYDTIGEYGFGIKSGPFGTGYLFGGNTGLQLVFKNGTSLIVATRNPIELEKILGALS